MTESAPSERTKSAFAALVVVVTRAAPYALESWMPVAPVPPLPPRTRTLAFGANGAPPYHRSALYDVSATLPSEPASAHPMFAGTLDSCASIAAKRDRLLVALVDRAWREG